MDVTGSYNETHHKLIALRLGSRYDRRQTGPSSAPPGLGYIYTHSWEAKMEKSSGVPDLDVYLLNRIGILPWVTDGVVGLGVLRGLGGIGGGGGVVTI